MARVAGRSFDSRTARFRATKNRMAKPDISAKPCGYSNSRQATMDPDSS
ncbi:hypothetical protein BIFDEN_01360 [Bifidobacterium dentium ATCC 27678]|nr:hypothetical protein BIFDEN_01360 [Bifidobacterium dentium ATCC 27678]